MVVSDNNNYYDTDFAGNLQVFRYERLKKTPTLAL